MRISRDMRALSPPRLLYSFTTTVRSISPPPHLCRLLDAQAELRRHYRHAGISAVLSSFPTSSRLQHAFAAASPRAFRLFGMADSSLPSKEFGHCTTVARSISASPVLAPPARVTSLTERHTRETYSRRYRRRAGRCQRHQRELAPAAGRHRAPAFIFRIRFDISGRACPLAARRSALISIYRLLRHLYKTKDGRQSPVTPCQRPRAPPAHAPMPPCIRRSQLEH